MKLWLITILFSSSIILECQSGSIIQFPDTSENLVIFFYFNDFVKTIKQGILANSRLLITNVFNRKKYKTCNIGNINIIAAAQFIFHQVTSLLNYKNKVLGFFQTIT